MRFFFIIVIFFIHFSIIINIRNHEALNFNKKAKHATTHIRQDRNSGKLDLTKNYGKHRKVPTGQNKHQIALSQLFNFVRCEVSVLQLMNYYSTAFSNHLREFLSNR